MKLTEMEFGCDSQINEIGWDSEIVIWLTVKLNDDLTVTAKFDCHSEFGCHNQFGCHSEFGCHHQIGCHNQIESIHISHSSLQ